MDLHMGKQERRVRDVLYCIVVNGGSVFDGAELQALLCPETRILVVNWYSLNEDSMRLDLLVWNCTRQNVQYVPICLMGITLDVCSLFRSC